MNSGNISFVYPAGTKNETWTNELTNTDFPNDEESYYSFKKSEEGNMYSIIVNNGSKCSVLTLFTGKWKANKGKSMVEALQTLSTMIIAENNTDASTISEQLYFLASTLVADNIPAGNTDGNIVYTYDNNSQLEQCLVNTLHKVVLQGQRIFIAKENAVVASQYYCTETPEKMVYTVNSSKITSGVEVDKEYVAEGETLKLTYTKEGDYQPIEVDVDIDGVSNQYLLYNGSEILIRSIVSSLQFQQNIPEPVAIPVSMPTVEPEEEEDIEETVPIKPNIITVEKPEEEFEGNNSRGISWITPLLTFLLGLVSGLGAMYLLYPQNEGEKEITKVEKTTDTVFVTKHDTISHNDTIKVNGKTKVEYKTVEKVVEKTVNKTVYVAKEEPEEHFNKNAYKPAGETARIESTESADAPEVVQGHGPSYPGGDEAMKAAIQRNPKLSPYAVKQGNPNASVFVEFTVDAEGRVSNITSKGHPQLKASVEEAVRRLKFEPATNGTTAKKSLTIPFKI